MLQIVRQSHKFSDFPFDLKYCDALDHTRCEFVCDLSTEPLASNILLIIENSTRLMQHKSYTRRHKI